MGPFLFLLTALCIVSLVSGQELVHCSHNSTRGGVCVLQSEFCCHSYKGSECKQELSQDHEEFAPRLLFSNSSLLIDYRPGLPSLVCIERLQTERGTGIRGKEIRGIYFEVHVWNSKQEQEIMFSSGTTVFPGNVTRSPLENGLFCLEVELSEEELAKESNSLTFLMAPLSASYLNPEPVVYSSEPSKPKSISVCDVTNVDIYITNCFTWNKTVLSQKSCRRENGEIKAEVPGVIKLKTTRPQYEVAKSPISDGVKILETPSLGSDNDKESIWTLWAVISTTMAVCLLVALISVLVGGAVALKKIRRKYKKKLSKTAYKGKHPNNRPMGAEDGSSRRRRGDTGLKSQGLRHKDQSPGILSNSQAQPPMSGGEELNYPQEGAEKEDVDKPMENSVEVNVTTFQQTSKVIEPKNYNCGEAFATAVETRPGESNSPVSTEASRC